MSGFCSNAFVEAVEQWQRAGTARLVGSDGNNRNGYIDERPRKEYRENNADLTPSKSSGTALLSDNCDPGIELYTANRDLACEV